MTTLSIDYAQKLRAVRKAEGLTQQKFSDITGLNISTIKRYESGHQSARSETLEKVLQVQLFEKYTLWLIHGKTAPVAGQIAPALSLDGSEELAADPASTNTTQKSHR